MGRLEQKCVQFYPWHSDVLSQFLITSHVWTWSMSRAVGRMTVADYGNLKLLGQSEHTVILLYMALGYSTEMQK